VFVDHGAGQLAKSSMAPVRRTRCAARGVHLQGLVTNIDALTGGNDGKRISVIPQEVVPSLLLALS